MFGLYPCPFCGEVKKVGYVVKKNKDGSRVGYAVRCEKCGAQTGWRKVKYVSELYREWNHRVEEPTEEMMQEYLKEYEVRK